jgi:hypothetical protein
MSDQRDDFIDEDDRPRRRRRDDDDAFADRPRRRDREEEEFPPEKKGSGHLILILSLCAVGFIAILSTVAIGLLLPSVQKVRGAAARMACANNLKQLGIAIHNYASTYNERLIPQSKYDNLGQNAWCSYHFQTLPFIEQDALYKRAWGADGCWNNGNNAAVVKTFLCPADSTHTNGLASNGWAVVSYLDNTQVFASITLPDPQSGRMTCQAKYNIGNIPDGTSNTIAVVERYSCTPASGYSSLWAAPCGGEWGWPETSHAYGMWSTGIPDFDTPPEKARFDVPSSGHDAATNVLMMDGSVHAVKRKVTATTWLNALIPDDGQILGKDLFE